MPPAASFFGSLLFGAIGMAAMAYGKSMGQAKTMLIGGTLIGYTFFIDDATTLWLVGAGLCALLYFWRD